MKAVFGRKKVLSAMNSHIQLPNFIIKNFRDVKTGDVPYLDLNQQRIRSCRSAVLGTEPDYYSVDMEKYLSKNIELPFSNVVSAIKGFLAGQDESINLPITVEDDFVQYLVSSLSRSCLAFDIYKKNSIFSQFIPGMVTHERLLAHSLQNKETFAKRFADFKMVVIGNDTQIPFVVPRNCTYSILYSGEQHIIAPVSPTFAFSMIPVESKEFPNEAERLVYIKDPEFVAAMNNNALMFEYTFNKCFVATPDRDELNRLKYFLQKNFEILEKNRTEIRESK